MIDVAQRDAAITGLLQAQGPRVSIFLPTHRAYPDNQRDPIVFKNSIQQAEALLTERWPRRDWEGLIARLTTLQEDQAFWAHTTEGLAVLAAQGQLATFHLEEAIAEQVIVGDHFHLLPIYPLLQSTAQAYLVDISRDRFTIHQVSREGTAQVELPDVKASFPELFDDFDKQADLNVGSYSGLIGTHHGHRARAEEVQKDREKYFRYLDEAFTKLHKQTGLPMILAGTESNLAQYRGFAKGNFYLEGAITQPLDSLDHRQLSAQVRDILQPQVHKVLDSFTTRIRNARKEGKAESRLPAIHQAAGEGRVAMLLSQYQVPEGERARLDEAATQVLQQGGELYAISPDDLDLGGRYLAMLRF
ncbi:MAG: hypothetical protein GXY84_08205 [Clostridiales bacterium]|nr:hypothetical protein [Clostridiales bacterium]